MARLSSTPANYAPIWPEDGCTMAFAPRPASTRSGSGQVAVFLLHGVGGGKEVWRDNLDVITQAGAQAIAWDMPGYGASAPVSPCNTGNLAAALEHLIDDVGAQRNVLLGHSMGGMVAQEAVALFPHKVHGLILSATSAAFGPADGAWQRQFLQSRFTPLDQGLGMDGLARTLVPGMMGPTPPGHAIALAQSVMAGVAPDSYRAALSAIVSFNRLDNLARIAVPTLCLAGEHDRNASAAVMLKMSGKISGAQYHCLSGAGHLANMEQASAFNACVRAFLQQHFVPWRASA